MRTFVAMLLAGAALVAAGCGGSGSSTGTSSAVTEATGSLAPRDAGLWLSVDTDRTSAQWQALDGVLARIPGAEGLVDDALAQIGPGDRKLDFRRDVQPALGKELVLVLPAGAADPVVLVKPDDAAKLDTLLAQSGTPAVKGERDGWTVVAQTQKALDAYDAAVARGTLVDSDAFAKAMDGLPADALVRAYVDGKGVGGAAGGASGVASGALKSLTANLGTIPQTQGSVDPKALERIGIVGLAVSADDQLVRVDGAWKLPEGTKAGSFTPTLLGRVPADALAAFSFDGRQLATDQVRSALEQAGAGQLDQVEQTLGVPFDQLLHVADGEGVLYVRPGLIIPEVTAVLTPSDPARSLETIDAVVAKLASSGDAKVGETTQGGVHWKQVTVSILSIAWARDGDRVVVTTQPQGLEVFDGQNAKLVDAARFKTAAADVGFDGDTSGFAYVDVKGLTPLVTTLAGAAGSSTDPTFQQVVKALGAIDTVAVDWTGDDAGAHFQGAVRVR
jgi:hypothetical protein